MLAHGGNAEVLDTVTLQSVSITDDAMNTFLISRMADVGNGVISAAKKTEVVTLEKLPANTSTNNVRQIFSSVVGLNVWESDALGLQMGIGGRGLSPDRTSNFTTRQNGYDIAADPLGYPESYYTPPMDLVDRIEVTRGGGALRYGTQFGGVVNFVTKQPQRESALLGNVSLAAGSYGLAVGTVQLGGTSGAVGYSGFYQHKQSDGWRANSDAHQNTAYVQIVAALSNTIRILADYTFMQYLAHQPGGLSDKMFADDPSQSVRSRNWFSVNWNVASVQIDAILDTLTTLRTQFSGMVSSRTALGNLNRITMADLGGPRTMIDGGFVNLCNETTITRDIPLFGNTSAIAAGIRLFKGNTTQQQGNASAQSGPDFEFTNPDSLEGSDYTFPNTDVAVFAEGVLRLGNGLSVVPGIRYETIRTGSDGWYRILVNDLAGNHVVDSVVYEQRTRNRGILLGGLGLAWQANQTCEVYGNIVQNYRAITFTDLRVVNPNQVVDPNISDERGFTVDLGIRGVLAELLAFDASLFYLRYNNKIGEVLRNDMPPLYIPYRYRTNVSDAYTAGIEAVADLDVGSLLRPNHAQAPSIHLFTNVSVMNGEYGASANSTIAGKKVEFVPPYTIRIGCRVGWNALRLMLMNSWVGNQYSDATNSEYSATAVTGIIPAYSVMDVSADYALPWFTIKASVNNVLNAPYFTRRATSYPGPGIIPSEALTITLGIQANIDVLPRTSR